METTINFDGIDPTTFTGRNVDELFLNLKGAFLQFVRNVVENGGESTLTLTAPVVESTTDPVIPDGVPANIDGGTEGSL